MNKVYKLVWNARRKAFIVTSEKAQSKGRLFLVNLLSVATLTAAMVPVSYAQCIETSLKNNSCETKITSQYANQNLLSLQRSDYLNHLLSTANLNGSVEISLPHHLESNDDGYTYTSNSDVDNLVINQPAGNIIGGTNGVNINHNGTGSTNISINGDVTGKQNDGIHASNSTNTQDLNIIETVGADIHGNLNGINVANNGHGTTTITTSDSVVGDESDGIVVVNDGDTKGIKVIQSAGSIHGKKNGINADNRGKETTHITTAGEVIGDDNEGINAVNEQNAGNMAIEQNSGSISGHLNGIKANNLGNGSTTITTTAKITGQNNDGIFVNNNSNTHDLSITQSSGSISGELNGINATNGGNGATIVTTSGTITANQQDGVAIVNQANTRKLTFNQLKGDITGKQYGINIVNNGNGLTSINSYGNVEGQQKDGIFGIGGVNTNDLNVSQSTGSIKGELNGINMTNQGNGSTLITTNGEVTGHQNDGIFAVNEVNTHELTINQSAGNIHGQSNGININNKGSGSTIVSASGDVIGDNNYGISAVNETNTKDLNIRQPLGNIHGKLDGINVEHKGTGTTTIATSGQVIGDQENGIYAITQTNTKNLTAKQSSGSILGKKNGINFNNLGTGSTFINTAGQVEGSEYDGILVNNDTHSQDVNVMQTAGSIKGNLNGINVNNKGNGTTSITTSNDVIGTQNNGMTAVNEQNTQDIIVSQLAGNIQGLQNGINMFNNGKGATSINTSGMVIGKLNDGIYAFNNNNTTDLKVSQLEGEINGKHNGMTIENNGQGLTSITTLGKVISDQEDGIFATNNTNSKDLNIIQSGGEIIGNKNGINIVNNGQRSTVISIAGKVIGNNSNAISAVSQSSTNNLLFGQTQNSEIIGKLNSVDLANHGQGSTGLKVAGKIVSLDLDAIIATNYSNSNNLTFRQESDSEIQGAKNGINFTNHGNGITRIVSEGKITANNGSAILAFNSDTASDLLINQTGGIINGFDNGIEATNSGTGITEINIYGKVEGQSGAGIYTTGKEGLETHINLNQGADVSSASDIAIKNETTNSIISLNDGSKISGQIRLGEGNDTLFINEGADISQLTAIDGGNKFTRVGGSSDDDTLNLNVHLIGSSTSSGSTGNVSIVGWENINLSPIGKLTLTGDLNTDQLTLESGAIVDLQSTLHQSQISGSVHNGGTITLGNSYAGDSLIIAGDYFGDNGKLVLDTVVQNSNSPTDRLFVNGNVSGNTFIQINNINGLGADTSNTNGIELVHVDGVSTHDAFKIPEDHLDVGAYEYYLHKGDLNNQNNNWYLRSYLPNDPTNPTNPTDPTDPINPTDPMNPTNPTNPTHPIDPSIDPDTGKPVKPAGVKTYRKEVPLFGAIAEQLRLAENIMQSNLHQRIGNMPLLDSPISWGRIITKRIDVEQNGITNPQSKGNYTGFQLGSDFWQEDNWRLGAYFGYLYGNMTVNGFASGRNGQMGKNGINSYFLGAYSTYMQDNGTYLDIVLQGARHRVNVKPDGNKNSKQKSYGLSASIETGKPFILSANGWKFEPQAQIIHQWLDMHDSHISGNTKVKHSNNNAVLFRIGARFEGNFKMDDTLLRPYARVNLFYSPSGADHITFASKNAATEFSNGAKYLSSEMAIGGSFEINNQFSAYTEIGHTWTNGGDARVKAPFSASVGIRANW